MITILTWGQGKRTVYPEVDWVVNCLNLDNPPATLWNLDGRDVELRIYMVWQLNTFKTRGAWFNRVESTLLDAASKAPSLTIGFYCFGGRHRSVSIAELMKKIFQKKGYRVAIKHLELQ